MDGETGYECRQAQSNAETIQHNLVAITINLVKRTSNRMFIKPMVLAVTPE